MSHTVCDNLLHSRWTAPAPAPVVMMEVTASVALVGLCLSSHFVHQHWCLKCPELGVSGDSSELNTRIQQLLECWPFLKKHSYITLEQWALHLNRWALHWTMNSQQAAFNSLLKCVYTRYTMSVLMYICVAKSLSVPIIRCGMPCFTDLTWCPVLDHTL